MKEKWHNETCITYTVRVWTTGAILWRLDDKLHREDGPAVEYAHGEKEWWLHGKKLTEEEWKQEKK
jgi:hypothetical protein|tara:strand:+ start:280 stop:477 length:198 start_codon:yes stop_codon:yes gene_type:complete